MTYLEYAKSFLEEVLFCDAHFRIIQVPPSMADQFHIGQDMRKIISPAMIYDQESIMRNRQLIGYKYKLYQVKNEKGNTPTYPGVASRSKSYQQFLNQVIKVSTTSVPIHIFGESGSGKEIISQTIHQNSPQKNGPLIAINCGLLVRIYWKVSFLAMHQARLLAPMRKGLKENYHKPMAAAYF